MVLTVFSAFCFFYPTVSNLINDYFNESRIGEYNKNVDSTSKEEIESYFLEAESYNRAIAADFFNTTESNEYSEIINNYNYILDFDNGLIGYIEIPKINVKLPVYHGESEDVLKKGAAHLERTSFPTGGMNTRVCISAHSGYPAQKFFDDIDELQNGDVIKIKILNRTLEYKVCGNDVVEPNDVSLLRVETGKSLLTLITCYPYGINSHRLLVNAELQPASETTPVSAATEDETTPTNQNRLWMPILSLIIAVAAILASAYIIRHFYKKRKERGK